MPGPSRREVILGGAAIGLSCAAPARPRPRLDRRVLLIDLDDIGRELLEQAIALGGAPNLRRAIQFGRSYSDFWAAPFCSPFRARVLTGLDAYRPGNLVGTVIKQVDLFAGPTATPWLPAGLPGTKVKIGKWHISNGQTFPANVIAGGYDRFQGLVQNVNTPSGDYYDWTEWYADSGGASSQQVTQHNTTRTAALALAEVALGTELIHVSFQAVHEPLQLPPDNEPQGKVYAGQTDSDKRLDMLFHLDHWVGQLVNAAVPQGYVVLIACDNGTMDDGKGTHTEDGNNTNLIVCGQGVIAGPSARLVQATDLWATVRRLRGDATTTALDSLDFTDDFMAVPPIAAPRPHMTLDWFPILGAVPPAGQWSRMIRDARWKYLDRKTSPVSTVLVPLQGLWDLDNDPEEQTNLLNAPLTSEAQSAYDTLLANLPT